MMMKEMFYKNPYQKVFDATVLECSKTDGGYAVVLDDTCFYPEQGGQPCDYGTINGYSVTNVQNVGEQIVHYIEQELVVGETVHGEIDFARRFQHMQSHTGEHIVSGLIHQTFGYDNVGFHMGETIQIDFNGVLTPEEANMIVRKANEAIWRNLPVQVNYPTDVELEKLDYRSKKELTGVVRIIHIDDVDTCACCGTHVAYTGEIGIVQLLSVKKQKRGTRLEILCGGEAYDWLQKITNENEKNSVMMSVPQSETSRGLEQLLQRYEESVREIQQITYAQLCKQIAQCDISDLTLLFTENVDRKQLIQGVNQLLERGCKVAGICSKTENGYAYVFVSKEISLSNYCKEWNKQLNGRGGGKGDFVQGSFNASQQEIEEVVHI